MRSLFSFFHPGDDWIGDPKKEKEKFYTLPFVRFGVVCLKKEKGGGEGGGFRLGRKACARAVCISGPKKQEVV